MRRIGFVPLLIVQASAAVLEEDVIRGISAPIPPGTADALPETIQLFPPGKHTITAMKNDKPATMTLTIDKSVADVIRKDFLAMCSDAERMAGPKPYIDFNHEDAEASGWISDVFWAGEDPMSGGVRAKLVWTDDGAKAVKGKAYRQFSPNFRVAKDDGSKIIGTTVNMGGLVNRPAFRKNQPLSAKEGEQKQKATMNKLQSALVTAGLLSAESISEDAAAVDFTNRWEKVKARHADFDRISKDLVTAKEAQTKAETELGEVKAKHKDLAEAHADTVIAKWVDLGVMAPKDDAGKKLWRERLIANPKDEALMDPVISAKDASKGGAGKVTDPVVRQGGKENSEDKNAVTDPRKEFEVKAKEIETAEKVSASEAVVRAAQRNPKLYEQYRETTVRRS